MALDGWQVAISKFSSADRKYLAVENKDDAQHLLDAEHPGVKIEWEEDAENGIYAVTLTQELYDKLTTKGYLQEDRGGVMIDAEVDLDQIEPACPRCGAKFKEDPSCGKTIHNELPSREAK